MLPFFRKIRKQMADENRAFQYFRYAIGEIVLVVIGILIALYINNWNESRIDRKFEQDMLKEVANSLRSDMVYLDMISRRNEVKENALREMYEMIESGKEYPDSVLLKIYNEATLKNAFSYNKGGYESIKSVGLDRISDEKVRAGLIQLYESDLPVRTQIMMYFQEYQDTNQDVVGLHNALWTRIITTASGGQKKIVSRPKNKDFLKQQELIERLKIEQDVMSFNKMHIALLKQMIDEGIQLVENNLAL